jgi:hypothetical protein
MRRVNATIPGGDMTAAEFFAEPNRWPYRFADDPRRGAVVRRPAGGDFEYDFVMSDDPRIPEMALVGWEPD